MNGPTRPRYTLRELIILILTIGLASTLVLAVGGLIITKLIHPDLDLIPAARVIGETTQILVGVIVGYLVGRPAENGKGL